MPPGLTIVAWWLRIGVGAGLGGKDDGFCSLHIELDLPEAYPRGGVQPGTLLSSLGQMHKFGIQYNKDRLGKKWDMSKEDGCM